jgi:hypothetical protein
MRSYVPKVGRHVNYLTSAGKLRPATITAVTSNTVVNLRIGRSGETITGAVKQSADNQSNVWRNTDAYQNV